MLRKQGSIHGVFALCVVMSMLIFALPSRLSAQSNSGIVQGTVTDPSKAAIPGAKVHLENPVSHHVNDVETDTDGNFRISNIPFNPYHLTVTAQGFTTFAQDIDVRSTVPISLTIGLTLGGATTNITVTESAADLVEEDSNFHTDVDRSLFDKLPLESPSSSVSSLITLSSPGVVADSNGLFHGLGDHAENSFSVDGQPITDQQSKIFSNQIPADAIQSIEVISGAPPAEYGDKTSLVINVTTRSGLGETQPHGSVTASYGSFRTGNVGFDLGVGGSKWGNFIAANGLNSDRFLDPPEFQVFHAKGNEENIFDRVDFKPNNVDTISLNGQFTRSWFQTPNSYDNLNIGATDPITGNPLGQQDQRAEIKTFNIAPSWSHLFGTSAVFTLGAFVRQDQFFYFPSRNPFADAGDTLSQNRKLTNLGIRTDLAYTKGIHNLKFGVTYQQTLLTENFAIGITDPTFLGSLADVNGNPCVDATGAPIASPCTDLAPFDLTRGGSPFPFQGHKPIKELALYVQDAITKGNWTFNLGIRGDLYSGFVTDRQAEPRLGIAYNIKPSNTVLRVSYARVMETPFNENLVLASTASPIIADILGFPPVPSPVTPGHRNEFHAGIEQAFGRHLVVDTDYMWKYTHGGYDFSALTATTPIFFPIEWHNSKITGVSARVNVPNYKGLSLFVVMGSVAARFFNPQIGGLGAVLGGGNAVFRIDHDQKFQQTTHIQYQPFARLPWIGFNWRYDSGLVAGALPCASCAGNGPLGDNSTLVDTSGLTADQQFEAGLFCGSIAATPTTPISSALGTNLCSASQYGSKFLKVPAPGTENDDHNPPRVAPRHLFDLSIGDDDVLHFHAERYKVSLRFTVINLTNKVALYNFLSTFSGTHYVTPRTATGEIGFHF
jgi:Carboxypeptidase regulatory-like domain/TonB-dependent Receptor Plug Domain